MLLRRGARLDHRPRGELQARHGDRLLPRRRTSIIGENGARGSAAKIRFAGPDHYEVTDARYTTCVAPREDWYLRMDELEIDKPRMVGTGHDATVRFFGVPIAYSPWFEFPLSNERKSGFLTPTLGLDRHPRLRVRAVPYYLNLAPNYDATITPRLMTKRGLQLGGQGRYLFETAQGEARRGVPAQRPRRPAPTATRCRAGTRRTSSVPPGLAAS